MELAYPYGYDDAKNIIVFCNYEYPAGERGFNEKTFYAEIRMQYQLILSEIENIVKKYPNKYHATPTTKHLPPRWEI